MLLLPLVSQMQILEVLWGLTPESTGVAVNYIIGQNCT
jgi:hypothetical protein